MNIKKSILSCMLMLGFVSASAQETKTEYVFNPHWYVQIQPLGAQYTLGEIETKDLLSYNVQAALGYQFHETLGLRLAVNAWQSKGGSDYGKAQGRYFEWKWKYVAPTVDLTVNLSNLFCGYNPNRVFNFSVYGGLGANIAWGNDEAADVNAAINGDPFFMYAASNGSTLNTPLSLLWDGTKVNFVGQFGANADFRLSDRVSLGLELSANTLTDHYNSKPAGNADWYFNALAGVKIALGDTYTTREVKGPEPRVIERVVEKVVEKPVYIEKEPAEEKVVVEPLRRDVFFAINSNRIKDTEGSKIDDVVAYLNKYPNAKVTVTGYADKGTGTAAINKRLGEGRSKVVVDTLVKRGIDRSRIIADSKGDTEQPFAENDKNRVTICIAE